MQLGSKAILVLLLTPWLVGNLVQAQQTSTPPDATALTVQRADETWLALVDSGNYAESWKQASPTFQSGVTQEKWATALDSVRTPLGSLKTRKLVSANYSTSLPGVPDGEYEVIVFETSFENKQLGHETVISKREKDGSWRIAGYYIK